MVHPWKPSSGTSAEITDQELSGEEDIEHVQEKTKSDKNETTNESKTENREESNEKEVSLTVTKTSTGCHDDNNEVSVTETKECSEHESPDQSIVEVTKMKIQMKDMPTRRRDETRGQFMCRLALQLKNRDSCYMKKEDVCCSDTTCSEGNSGDDGDVSDEISADQSVV